MLLKRGDEQEYTIVHVEGRSVVHDRVARTFVDMDMFLRIKSKLNKCRIVEQFRAMYNEHDNIKILKSLYTLISET